MRLSVIGTGYLGATHAAAMAELGHDVVGIDVNEARIERLRRGEAPFYEPGLSELLAAHVASGRLRFTTDASAMNDADVHFVCVGTPQQAGERRADLSYLDAAFSEVEKRARPGDVVVGRSTVPVGTAAPIAERMASVGARLVWNPEFLREGLAVRDCLAPDRIVLGTDDQAPPPVVAQVYEPIIAAGTPVVVTDFATAELVKVAANAFLATKISFINAMADICEQAGADVTRLAEALGHDPRVGPHFLRAGLGYGGSCLPKDIRALSVRAGELGVDRAVTLFDAVDGINDDRRDHIVDALRELVGGSLAGRRVAVLGLAFKPDSDDIRDSPALGVVAELLNAGATVRGFDPYAMDHAIAAHPALERAADPVDACRDADAVLLLTEWREFCELEPCDLASAVRRRNVVDGRSAWDPETWRAEGWNFRALGRP